MDNLDNSEYVTHSRSFEAIDSSHTEGAKAAPNLFQRIFQVFLSQESVSAAKPVRKVCHHQENAGKIRLELERAKQELKEELDPELMPLITEVIDPMLRDVERINRLKKREREEDNASLKFHEWTESAKLWVELFSRKWDKNAIKSEIVRHIIDKSFQSIEKDISFIERYFEQNLAQKALAPEELKKVRTLRGKRLAYYLEKMRNLKVAPQKDITLEASLSWRLELDKKRADLHDEALHFIDER